MNYAGNPLQPDPFWSISKARLSSSSTALSNNFCICNAQSWFTQLIQTQIIRLYLSSTRCIISCRGIQRLGGALSDSRLAGPELAKVIGTMCILTRTSRVESFTGPIYPLQFHRQYDAECYSVWEQAFGRFQVGLPKHFLTIEGELSGSKYS